jgi:hypothetical protein
VLGADGEATVLGADGEAPVLGVDEEAGVGTTTGVDEAATALGVVGTTTGALSDFLLRGVATRAASSSFMALCKIFLWLTFRWHIFHICPLKASSAD